jgi:cardiolipin synthase
VRRPKAIRRWVRERALRFTDGNRVDVYEDGARGLEAMLAAILEARRRVHLETYILRADSIGTRFLEALTGRARAGLEVRVLYDDVGSRGLPAEALAALRRAGGAVVAFNPLMRFWPRFAPRRRDHRKILVVDGQIAFTGGLNIGDEYALGIGRDGDVWRDTHVRVEGPAVRDLEAVFLESWFRADGPDVAWHDLLDASPGPVGNTRCAVLPDGPVYRRRRMRELLLSALEDARQEVRLQSPYFAPGRRVLDSLSAASERGVAVDLLLAGRTDHPVLRRAVRSILPRLLDCGVSVSEYETAMMHAKVGVFDGVWATVGTSNLDRQSFEHSYEVNLIVEGGDVPARLRDCFERDRERARRIDQSSLAARGLVERALDRLAAFVLWFV